MLTTPTTSTDTDGVSPRCTVSNPLPHKSKSVRSQWRQSFAQMIRIKSHSIKMKSFCFVNLGRQSEMLTTGLLSTVRLLKQVLVHVEQKWY